MVRYALKEGIKKMEGRIEGRKKEKLNTEKKKTGRNWQDC